MKQFYIFTQGCRINQYESQSIRESWLGQGLTETSSWEQADIFLVNSCAVTDRAVQDLRKTVRKMNRSRPEADIVVTGCAAGHFAEQLRELPGVSSIIHQEAKSEIGSMGFMGWKRPSERLSRGSRKTFPAYRITTYQRARPVLKVQDGCSQACAFCIVPLTRGPARSRNPEEILREACRIADSGFQELVISGINLGQYRFGPGPGRGFWEMLLWLDNRLRARYKDRLRLRLSSLDPGLLTKTGLEVLARVKLVCPHLHISVQSGSTPVLESMGRSHYTPDAIQAFVTELGEVWPKFGLGADFLIGFPGETESDFKDTISLCRKLPFSYGHVFPYSPRPGTRAMKFPGGLDEAVKKERSAALRSVLASKRRFFIESLLALPGLEVVLEQSNPPRGVNEYFTACYFETEPSTDLQGKRVRVRPARSTKLGLMVEQL